MRIIVLGGGVVGVTTAYQLQKDGHEVTILERNGLTAPARVGAIPAWWRRPFFRLFVAAGADDSVEIAVS